MHPWRSRELGSCIHTWSSVEWIPAAIVDHSYLWRSLGIWCLTLMSGCRQRCKICFQIDLSFMRVTRLVCSIWWYEWEWLLHVHRVVSTRLPALFNQQSSTWCLTVATKRSVPLSSSSRPLTPIGEKGHQEEELPSDNSVLVSDSCLWGFLSCCLARRHVSVCLGVFGKP